jgi:hypothetical protein
MRRGASQDSSVSQYQAEADRKLTNGSIRRMGSRPGAPLIGLLNNLPAPVEASVFRFTERCDHRCWRYVLGQRIKVWLLCRYVQSLTSAI